MKQEFINGVDMTKHPHYQLEFILEKLDKIIELLSKQ